MTGNIPAWDFVLVLVDLNCPLCINVSVYDEINDGYVYTERNSDCERKLEFCDAIEIIVTSTFFNKQKIQLATYVSGGILSANDYLLKRTRDTRVLRRGRKRKCIYQG